MNITFGNAEQLFETEKKQHWYLLVNWIDKVKAACGYRTSKFISYEPNNEHWELTFRELGWKPSTVELFYQVFHRMNTSCTGEVSFEEFICFFKLDKTKYTKRCFEYFDIIGGNSINFLEFMVSVWNICASNPDTLVNFAYDLYNLNSDGKLIYSDMKALLEELYGVTGKSAFLGKQCLSDLTNFAGTSESAISLENFAFFTSYHSVLLYPAFQIQHSIKQHVLGLKYWDDVRNQHVKRCKHEPTARRDENKPRDVQKILRMCKAKRRAANATKKRGADEVLREWYTKERDIRHKEATNQPSNPSRLLWHIFCPNIFSSLQKLTQNVFNRSIQETAANRVRHTIQLYIFLIHCTYYIFLSMPDFFNNKMEGPSLGSLSLDENNKNGDANKVSDLERCDDIISDEKETLHLSPA
jgi:Ca2+-binding EF-hand superfamily protein